MPCPYQNPVTNQINVTCKSLIALKQLADSIDNVMSPVELRQEICASNNCETLSQCPAYTDIQTYGRASGWLK